jgi:hypothetical protein
MTAEELRALVDVPALLTQIRQQWNTIQQDERAVNWVQRLTLGQHQPTPETFLHFFLVQAAEKLDPGALSAALKVESYPLTEYTVTTDDGTDEGVANGRAGLVGEVTYPLGKVRLSLIWVSHPFWQYRPMPVKF